MAQGLELPNVQWLARLLVWWQRICVQIAIYDLDRTLTRKPTFTPFLAFAAWQIAPWRIFLLPVWIVMMIGYRLGLYSRTTLKTAGMRLMLGKQNLTRLTEVGGAFARHHIAKSDWCDEVIELVEQDRKAGARLVIATAAFDFYAQGFAEMIGIDAVIGTRWNGLSIIGGNCYGPEKLRRIEEWLSQEGVSGIWRFVSDSFADAPSLNCAQLPVFVTTSRRKSARAQENGWAIINPKR